MRDNVFDVVIIDEATQAIEAVRTSVDLLDCSPFRILGVLGSHIQRKEVNPRR